MSNTKIKNIKIKGVAMSLGKIRKVKGSKYIKNLVTPQGNLTHFRDYNSFTTRNRMRSYSKFTHNKQMIYYMFYLLRHQKVNNNNYKQKINAQTNKTYIESKKYLPYIDSSILNSSFPSIQLNENENKTYKSTIHKQYNFDKKNDLNLGFNKIYRHFNYEKNQNDILNTNNYMYDNRIKLANGPKLSTIVNIENKSPKHNNLIKNNVKKRYPNSKLKEISTESKLKKYSFKLPIYKLIAKNVNSKQPNTFVEKNKYKDSIYKYVTTSSIGNKKNTYTSENNPKSSIMPPKNSIVMNQLLSNNKINIKPWLFSKMRNNNIIHDIKNPLSLNKLFEFNSLKYNTYRLKSPEYQIQKLTKEFNHTINNMEQNFKGMDDRLQSYEYIKNNNSNKHPSIDPKMLETAFNQFFSDKIKKSKI